MSDLLTRAVTLLLESIILRELSKEIRYGSVTFSFVIQDGNVVNQETDIKLKRNIAKEKQIHSAS